MKNIQSILIPAITLILALGISGTALADEDPEAKIIVIAPTLETSTNEAVLFEVCI